MVIEKRVIRPERQLQRVGSHRVGGVPDDAAEIGHGVGRPVVGVLHRVDLLGHLGSVLVLFLEGVL
ncbi:MAG: hypothetical protein ABEJ55_06675 [Halanaeroarchaeum sp.]